MTFGMRGTGDVAYATYSGHWAGATLVAGQVSAENRVALAVTGTSDGGFVVRVNFREVWRVSGAQIKEHWLWTQTPIQTRGECTAVSLKKIRLLAKMRFSSWHSCETKELAMRHVLCSWKANRQIDWSLPFAGTILLRANIRNRAFPRRASSAHVWANTKLELANARSSSGCRGCRG